MDDAVIFKPKGYPLRGASRAPRRSMDLGVVGNRRSAAGDLMLPVKLLEYVSLGIPAVVPRLKTIEHYFSDDMVAYYEPEDVAVAGRCHLPAVQRAGAPSLQADAARAVPRATTGGSGRAPSS